MATLLETTVVENIRGDLALRGFAVLDLTGEAEFDLVVIEQTLAAIGQPIHVFRRQPFWKPLEVDLGRPLDRSGGIGLNGLHLDCVNVSNPPDLVCLYVERADPLGGGANLLVEITGIEKQLCPETKALLSRRVFSDGVAVDLDHVGEDINPFAVLDLGADVWRYRFSARLLAARLPAAEHLALRELNELLWHRVQVFPLAAGQALVVDQRRVLHGRLPLHPSQAEVEPSRRRRLVQAYWRLP